MDLPVLQNEMLSYNAYVKTFESDMNEAQESGNKARYDSLKLNLSRMKRIEKNFVPGQSIKVMIGRITTPLQWNVVAEPWCADGSQIIPMLQKLADLNPAIDVKYVLRDRVLKKDMPIPMLYCLDKKSNRELFRWGSRPEALQQKFLQMRSANPEMGKPELYTHLHKWYAADNGNALQEDLQKKLEGLKLPMP